MCVRITSLFFQLVNCIFLQTVTFSCVASLALPYFFTLSLKWYHFRNIKYVSRLYWQSSSEKRVFFRTFHRGTVKTYIRLHIRYPLSLSHLNQSWIFTKDFEKSWNIKFHENPSSGSRVVPCGKFDELTDEQKKKKHGEATSGFSQFCKGSYNGLRELGCKNMDRR